MFTLERLHDGAVLATYATREAMYADTPTDALRKMRRTAVLSDRRLIVAELATREATR